MTLIPDFHTPLTKQDLFDRAWKWSRTHGAALDGGDGLLRCRYRVFSDGGVPANACFIGCSIPDSRYNDMMEHKGLVYLWDKLNGFGLFASDVTKEFAQALQSIHDRSALENITESEYLSYITAALTRFASEHGLTIPS